MSKASEISSAVKSDSEYEKWKPAVVESVKVSTDQHCRNIIATIKKIIKHPKSPPPMRLRALNLLHACIMVGNTKFLVCVQKKIMKRLREFAQHRKNSTDENRGRDIFGPLSLSSEENSRASAQFLKNLLRYIQEWRCNFGKGPDGKYSEYYLTHVFLVKENVKFPTVPKPVARTESRPDPRPAQRQHRPANVVETVQTTLSLAHEMVATGQTDSDRFFQTVSQLMQLQSQIEDEVSRSMNSGDSSNVEMLLELNDLVQGFLRANAEPTQPAKPLPRNEQSSPRYAPSFATHAPQSGNLFSSQDTGATVSMREFEQLKQANARLTQELQQCRQNCEQYKQTIQQLQRELAQLRGQPSSSPPVPQATQANQDLFGDLLSLDPRRSSQGLSNVSYSGAQSYQTAPSFQPAQLAFSPIGYDAPQSPTMQNPPSPPMRGPVQDYSTQASYFQPPQQVAAVHYPQTGLAAQPKKQKSKSFLSQPSNPFDTSSSSDEEVQIVAPVSLQIENADLCRVCNCFDRGVLFDDDSLQVGIQLSFQEGVLAAMLYVGNKATEPLQFVSTEVIDFPMDGLAVTIDQTVTQEPVMTGAQAFRNLQIQLTNISAKFPILKLQVRHSSPRFLVLRLPVSLLRFIKPLQVSGPEAVEEWNTLAPSEKQTELQLAGISSMQELCMHLFQGGAFTVYSPNEAPSLGQGELLSGGTFMMGKVFVEVTVEPSMKAALRVRSMNAVLREAVFTLMHEQLSGQEVRHDLF